MPTGTEQLGLMVDDPDGAQVTPWQLSPECAFVHPWAPVDEGNKLLGERNKLSM